MPAGIIAINNLEAQARLEYVTKLVAAHRAGKLDPLSVAAAAVAQSGDGGPQLPILEQMSTTLADDAFYSDVRRLNSNMAQDRVVAAGEAYMGQVVQHLNNAIRRKDRRLQANALAPAPATASAAANAAHAVNQPPRPKPMAARWRLKPAVGTIYPGPDGAIPIYQFLRMAQNQFDYADNGLDANNGDVLLTAEDKRLHVISLLDPASSTTYHTDVASVPANSTKLTTYDFDGGTEDFTFYLKSIFNRQNERSYYRQLYNEKVAQGYYTDPAQILRDMRHSQTMIGNVEADNTITDEKLLTDYLSALPTEMQTAVYRDKEFDVIRMTANSAAAAVVIAKDIAFREYTAARAAYSAQSNQGRPTPRARLHSMASSPAVPASTLALLPDNHSAHVHQLRDHQEADHIAALAESVGNAIANRLKPPNRGGWGPVAPGTTSWGQPLSQLLGEGSGSRSGGWVEPGSNRPPAPGTSRDDLCNMCEGPPDEHSDSMIKAIAVANDDLFMMHSHADINALAQRQYNSDKRKEMQGERAEIDDKFAKMRCFNCGQFGHPARLCDKPRAQQRTPFRRLSRRTQGPRRGMQPPNRHSIIPVNLFRKNQQTGRMYHLDDADVNDLGHDEVIYAAEADGGTQDEFFIIA